MKQNDGLFIVFEGLDKSGKTSLATSMVEKLSSKADVFYQKGICSNTLIGKIAKRHPSTLIFILECIYVSAMNYFKLKSGAILIQDRYYISIASYLPIAARFYNKALVKLAEKILPQPDILIYCTVSKNERMKRLLDDTKNIHHQELIKNNQLIDIRERAYKNYFNKHNGRKILIDTTNRGIEETVLKIIKEFTLD